MEKFLAETAIYHQVKKRLRMGYFKPLTTLQLEDTNRHAVTYVKYIDLQISKRQNLAFCASLIIVCSSS